MSTNLKIDNFKSVILDLDNTIFSPRQITFSQVKKFFDFIYQLIPNSFSLQNESVYEDFVHLSLGELIDKYRIKVKNFKSEFKKVDLFKHYIGLKPFDDYAILRQTSIDKFLVTTGLTEFQRFKIRNLAIENDFKDIIIDDPIFNPIGKTGAFSHLIETYRLNKSKILVIGDNPDSEIKAANDLNLSSILIKRNPNKYPDFKGETIFSFEEIL